MRQILKYSALSLLISTGVILTLGATQNTLHAAAADVDALPQWQKNLTQLSDSVSKNALEGTPQQARQDGFKIMSLLMSGSGHGKKSGTITEKNADYAIRGTGPSETEWLRIVSAITKASVAFQMDDRMTRLYDFIQGDDTTTENVLNQSRAVSTIYWAVRHTTQKLAQSLGDYVRAQMGNADFLTDAYIQGRINRHGMNFAAIVNAENPVKMDNINDLDTHFKGYGSLKRALNKQSDENALQKDKDQTKKNIQTQFVRVREKNKVISLISDKLANHTEHYMLNHYGVSVLTPQIQKMRKLCLNLIHTNMSESLTEELENLNKVIVFKKSPEEITQEFMGSAFYYRKKDEDLSLNDAEVTALHGYITTLGVVNGNPIDLDDVMQKRACMRGWINHYDKTLNGLENNNQEVTFSKLFEDDGYGIKATNLFNELSKDALKQWAITIERDRQKKEISLTAPQAYIDLLDQITQAFGIENPIPENYRQVRTALGQVIPELDSSVQIRSALNSLRELILNDQSKKLNLSKTKEIESDNNTYTASMAITPENVDAIDTAFSRLIPEWKGDVYNQALGKYKAYHEFWTAFGAYTNDVLESDVEAWAKGTASEPISDTLSDDQKIFLLKKPLAAFAENKNA